MTKYTKNKNGGVGNHGYFRARNYYVREVATGKEVDLNRVTRSMLISGAYGIAQRGGKGNALGRIIFRFEFVHADKLL